MKALKAKVIKELEDLERIESLSKKDLTRNTLDLMHVLSKTLCYLEKAERIIDGTYTHEAAPVSATGRKPAMD